MIAELVLGTVGTLGLASGIGALVFWRKHNGNGKHDPWQHAERLAKEFGPVQQQAPARVEVQWPPELAAVLTHITERLEGALTKMENPPMQLSVQPPWPEIVGELERVTKRVLVASRETKPEWAGRIESDLAENDKRLERIAADLSENMANGMARFYAGVSKDLAAAVDLPALNEIAEKLETIVDAIPEADPRPELTAELTRQLAELPARIGRSMSETLTAERKKNPPPPSAEKNKGNNPPPPPYAPPRNLPPMNPNELPATPSIPASYVAGTVHVPAGDVWSLLLLIQKQLSPNCPGTSASFALSAGEGTIYVGSASSIGGKLSQDNYAYKLEEGEPPHTYRSVFPGNNTPVGELQVLGSGSVHVEVQS